MSEKIFIDVEVDTSELDIAEGKRQKLETDTTKTVSIVQEESTRSYNQVMNMARGSLMAFTGIAHAIGGTFGRVFSAVYQTAISVFTLYKTVAVTTAAFNPALAAIQFAAVIMSMMNLASVAQKQRETSRILLGVTSSLHGVSMMLGNYSM